MPSKWIDRDGSNNIIAVYANKQRLGQEKLTDQDQEVKDFLNPPYAADLASAKQKKKKESKKEAVRLFNEYRDTDLELTSVQLDAYRSSLISQKTTISTEIDNLTTIEEVRDYQYNNWPVAL